MNRHDVLVIGCGIYGVTAALELNARGHRVGLIEPGPLPHPDAASTDISKVVRMEYGADTEYMAIVDDAITGWHAWNDEFGDVLYHETGATMFTRRPMVPGDFEHDSYHNLLARGHSPERLDAEGIARRFPAWKSGAYVDGFFNPRAGFVESGRVVTTLAEVAMSRGVEIIVGETAEELVRQGGRVIAVATQEGGSFQAQEIVVCAGAWTPWLVPELHSVMKASGHPVFHLQVDSPERFEPPEFAVFTADISHTGWYGFPVHPREGVLKVANHGVGLQLHPTNDERVVTDEDERHLREFLAGTFPDLVAAPIVFTRRCLYCDTLDEHLWIDRHPEIENLTVAAGGSGHAFKMAPLLGGFIADAMERRENPRLDKFRWRDLSDDTSGAEEARCHG